MARAKVLITGVGGFIGGRTATWLARAGYDVVGVSRTSVTKDSFAGDRSYVLELPDNSLTEILRLEKPDWLVHCAGPARVEQSMVDPRGDFRDSVVVTESILNALAVASPKTRVVLLSSAAVYGEPVILPITESTPPRPISPYGWHKLACEELGQEHHRRSGNGVAVMRVFSAYGEGLRRQVLWEICRQACTSPIVTLGGTGQERRDFIYVDDLAKVIQRIIERDAPGFEVLNVGSGTSFSIESVAELILRVLQLERRIIFSGELRAGSPRHWEADISQLSLLEIIQMLPLEAGLRRYLPWAAGQIGGNDACRVLAAAG